METYVVLPAGACVVQSAAHTVQHYQSAYHKLEERAEILPLVPGEGLSEFFDFCSTNDSGTERKPKEFIPESSFLVGLSSIYWRESWKCISFINGRWLTVYQMEREASGTLCWTWGTCL